MSMGSASIVGPTDVGTIDSFVGAEEVTLAQPVPARIQQRILWSPPELGPKPQAWNPKGTPLTPVSPKALQGIMLPNGMGLIVFLKLARVRSSSRKLGEARSRPRNRLRRRRPTASTLSLGRIIRTTGRT
ncbi:hypothetical protein NDU88_006148 [Pleurodeles waltl]|uniref:Uncharacterized protein n=1 Tax=Pleurodeles waltl TaxID=8319 RepID=A0AAV7N6E6_PLEWA|nr:hypothetical protein NDU88_006148 [Pleurodeles waltl]